MFQLQPVADRKVDMPFLVMTCDLFHLEALGGKSVVDFLTDLKGIKRDTGTDNGMKVMGIGMISGLHCLDRMLNDPLDRAAPTGMNGGGGMVDGVVEENGDTVSRRNADADSRDISCQAVNPFEGSCLFVCREGEESWIDDVVDGVMDLMGHDDMVIGDMQCFCQ